MAKNWLNRWRGGVAAVLMGALLLAFLTAENPLTARAEGKPTALPSDLAKVPSDSIVVVSGRVADLWDSDLAKPVREKLAKEIGDGAQAFEKQFGLRMEQVERLTLVLIDLPPAREEPLLFLHTTKPYEKDKVLAGRKVQQEKYKGQTLYLGDKNWTLYPLDDRSLVYGTPNDVRGLIDHPNPKTIGNLAEAVRLAAGKHSVVSALNVKVFNEAVGGQLPGEAERFRPLLLATSGTLIVDLDEQSQVVLKLTFATEKDAEAALKPAQSGLDLGRGALDQGIGKLGEQKEMTRIVELLKQAQTALKATKLERRGATLQASASLKLDIASAGVALLDGVRKVRGAASRTQSQNNLKQIGLAMHNYHATNNMLPPHATYDKNGKPLLSWRVFILPYIEQQDLYKQFHLDEPWDSEHNKKLLAKMPVIYAFSRG